MSKKQIIKFELEGKIVGSKPLFSTDNLVFIREKIKEKINSPYIFLDQDENDILQEDEKDYTLQDIVINEKIVKLKSVDNKNFKGIQVYFNNKILTTINCSKENKLEYLRKIIINQMKEDFIFLDSEENKIDKEDEKDYTIEDIINKGIIKIISSTISNISNDSPPATPFNQSNNSEENTVKNITPKEKKKIKDFSVYEIIEKRSDLTIYKYSNIKMQSNHKLVYQYYYDNFEIDDYQNAYVILLCGKTGDGKTTAINGFFNIIKGIELNDNYRFILISEIKKKEGQAVSQTDGVHLYYLKDYDNKPVIIIDSQGYGDTRGKHYDELVNEAFRFVFSSVIDHINTVCFISKSNTNRLDILTRYIFSSVTSLFSEDISENFIVLATFANKETMVKGPDFVESIKTDADFLNINKRMDENWWYALDSKCLFDNEPDKLTKYSFEKAKELYENKVKKLRPKSIKKCAEVLETRNELKIQVNNLNRTFQNLLVEQGNLQEKQKKIDEVTMKIKDMELKIANLINDMNKLSPKELEKKIQDLNNELNQKLNSLSNQTDEQKVLTLDQYNYCICTHCDSCKKNCHDNCDCNFSSLGRCKIFTVWSQKCEVCGCIKNKHKQDHYYYTYKTVTTKKNTDSEQEEEKKRREQEKKKILEEMDKKTNAKNNLERQKNELNYNKSKLEKEKINNINEKDKIQEKIKDINNQILFIIIKLQGFSEKINDIAMNNNHIKTEDEYIDSLKDKMDEIGYKDKEQIEKLQQIKKNNKIFQESVKLKREELLKLDDSQLAEKLKVIIPYNT